MIVNLSKRLRRGLMAAAVASACAPALASAKSWIDGTDFWSVPTNWSPVNPPVMGETVNIVFADGNPRTVTYNVNAPTLGLLSIDLTGAGTAASTLSIPNANNLTAAGIIVGGYNGSAQTTGRGVLTQANGITAISSGQDLIVGFGAGSSGVYTLTGGTFFSSQYEFIGHSGSGTFNHSGGTNNANGVSLRIATLANSTGIYNLSAGGALNVQNNEFVGEAGNGTFNQSGGSHSLNATKFLRLGFTSTGAGTYNLSGGTLVAGAEIVGDAGTGLFSQTGGANTLTGSGLQIGVGHSASYTLSAGSISTVFNSSEFVGFGATGNLTQSGGTNSINTGSHLHIGDGSTGTYTLSGGALSTAPASAQYLGEGGTGNFVHSGGTNTLGAGGELDIGYMAGSTATYSLSGTGALISNGVEYIGYSGTGSFNQSGGSNTIAAGVLLLGYNTNSTGTYTLSGGSLSVSGDAYIGASNGSGIFTQSGGSSTFGNDVRLGDGVSTTGTLTVSGAAVFSVAGTLQVMDSGTTVANLSGGTINAGALDFEGAPSRFNWTSGTLNITSNVTWDSAAPVYTTPAAFGAARTLGAAQTLIITGNETLGGTGTFALTLNSGSTHSVTGSMTINPTGTITQNTGSTLQANAIIQAGGTVNGTLKNQTTFTYQSGLFNGRLVNQGAVSFGSSFTTGNGVENDATMTLNLGQTLTVNGAGLDNRGTFTLAGGTLAGAGALVNNSVLSGRGTLAGAGGFSNNAYVVVSGGTLTLSNSGTNSNSGQIDVPAGLQLQLAGANLQNSGAINLIAGAISGSATLDNAAGIISGHGTISSPLANAATLAVDSGILNVTTAFTNSGEIYLAGGVASLNGGGAVTNTGRVRGDGVTNKPINNATGGEIRAESGKRIKLTGVNGANAGQVNLQGGTAEFSQALTNGPGGQIVGRGMLKVGGAGLTNNGQLSLSGGFSDVFGAVTTTSGGKIIITGGSTSTFYDSVGNDAGSEFRVSAGSTAVFFGAVSGSGAFTGSGMKIFEGGAPSMLAAISSNVGDTRVEASASVTAGQVREDSLQVNGALTIAANGTSSGTSRVNSLSINGGKLDLTNNKLIDASDSVGSWNGSSYSGVSGMIQSGRNGGMWNGDGIVTSNSSGNFTTLGIATAQQAGRAGGLFGGVSVSASDVLVMYTYGGDANLDGKINVDDYGRIDFNVNLGTSGWYNGDFNYDGKINVDDYGIIDFNVGIQGAPFPTGSSSAGGLSGATAVPEPAAAALIALSAVKLLARQRSRRRQR